MVITSEVKIEEISVDNETDKKTKSDVLLYSIDDVPPWYLCFFLGLQQYLTMFSGTISIPYILAPALCIKEDSAARAHLISSIMFSSGIITILQTTLGVRLPIVQGGTFAFLIPIFNMLNLPEWKCPSSFSVTSNVTMGFSNANDSNLLIQFDEDEIWQYRMRAVQGSIIIASLLEVFLGLTGCIGALLHIITPLTIVPTIALVGLSLFEEAAKLASPNWGIAFGTIALLFIFSQYLTSVTIPFPKLNRSRKIVFAKVPIFSLLPVLLTIILMWALCAILTTTDVLPMGSSARTDKNTRIVENSPWVRVPYPGQWGMPTISVAAVIGLFAGVIASIIESIGDYYACARLSGASPPPAHAINRGIMMEGIGCIIAGLFGTGVGTTSYSENIGAIGITKVGSRRVIQFAGLLMIFLGIFTKFGALFVSIPTPIVGGVFFVMFGMITAVGISNLQFLNLNSPRNLIIFGFSIFCGLAIPKWMSNNRDAIQTGSSVVDQVLFVLLTTNMLVGGVLGCFLDNTIPGTKEERGILKWREQADTKGISSSSYNIPFITGYIKKWHRWTSFIPICPTFEKYGNCFNFLRRKNHQRSDQSKEDFTADNLGFEDNNQTSQV